MFEKRLDNQDVGKKSFWGKWEKNPRRHGKSGKTLVDFCSIRFKKIDKK